MTISLLPPYTDKKSLLKSLNVEKGAYTILADKMELHLLKIEHLRTPAANILKQDALSIGADLAVPTGVIVCETEYVDAILIATTKQLKILAKKELAQPFGLKAFAKALKAFIPKKEPIQTATVMGIINANDDSFVSSSRFMGDKAIAKIEEMIAQGATIIDVGAVSSRPGAAPVSAQEELIRAQSIIDAIYSQKLYEQVQFSIDSYTPSVIEYALTHGFSIINDITGLANDKVCELAAHYEATVVIMHMQGSPQTMQNAPKYNNVTTDLIEFFQERIAKAKSFGIKDIILDVGIGFGKSLPHNIQLLQELPTFKTLGYPLLIGASRKSMIDHIHPTPVEDRLPGTLTIHLEAVRNGATIIRCHDVAEHAQALSVHNALYSIIS